MTKPTISLCMIVKNETAVLARCLDAAQWLHDELIVVDTGSEDSTVAIAEGYGAQVLHYDWVEPGHKGEARNMALDAATGDWVVVLDADEVLRDASTLRRWIRDENTDPNITGINLLFENYDADQLTLRWYQVRAFRRSLYRYKHREHELPHWQGQGRPVEVAVNITVEHRTPAGRASGKNTPMLNRLQLDAEEHPNDPHMYFLHRQYMLNGQYEDALQWGYEFLKLPGIDPCECYGNMATCCMRLDDHQAAIRWLHTAAAEQPQRRIWWIRLAEMYMAANQWNIAMAYLRGAQEIWPTFELQWEPVTYGAGLMALVDKCQRALQANHHTH